MPTAHRTLGATLALGASLALPTGAPAAVQQYGEDCQTATIEGTAAIDTADLASNAMSLPLDVCARGTADVRMQEGVVRMDDVQIGFYADPGQSLLVDLYENDDPGEAPSLTAELFLLDFAFLLLQTDDSLGSPSGSQIPADFSGDGKIDFGFTGPLAPEAEPLIDAFLTTAYGEPLFPASEFSQHVDPFIETTPDAVPSLLVNLLYTGPFDILGGLFASQITITAPRQFLLAPAGAPPPVCDPAPRTDCIAAGKAKLAVKEKKAGKEKLALQLKKLADPVAQADLGSPVAGATRYDVCVYDGTGTLAGGVGLDRAGSTCGKKGKPCWKDLSGRGFKYKDGAATAGVTQLLAKAGDAGKGKIKLAGRNKASKGQVGLPTGLAAALVGATEATAQLVVDGGTCFEGALTEVQEADGAQFKAKGP